MRNINEINKDIERCQKQISTTYEKEYSDEENRKITREGFQLQLHKLFEEKAMHLEVHDPEIVLSNGREELLTDSSTILKRRSLEACNQTIQQVKNIEP